MSINRRTAITVRSIGVASAAAAIAVGVAGNAFACSITEFTPSAACDSNGKGSIQVVDKDYSGTPVNITVTQGQNTVGEQKDVKGSREGVTVTFPVDWQPSTTYTVTVDKANGRGDRVGTKDLVTPAEACVAPTTPAPPSTSDSPTPSTSPSQTPSSTPATTASAPGAVPSSTASSSAPAVADTNAPSPAAGGNQNLAETGGGSNTGMIAGLAAALVALGGGALFVLRRRRPAARH